MSPFRLFCIALDLGCLAPEKKVVTMQSIPDFTETLPLSPRRCMPLSSVVQPTKTNKIKEYTTRYINCQMYRSMVFKRHEKKTAQFFTHHLCSTLVPRSTYRREKPSGYPYNKERLSSFGTTELIRTEYGLTDMLLTQQGDPKLNARFYCFPKGNSSLIFAGLPGVSPFHHPFGGESRPCRS